MVPFRDRAHAHTRADPMPGIDAPQPADQVGGERIASRMRRVGLTRRRIAAQRDDMAYAGVPVLMRDLVHFLAGRPDAREVRHRLDAEVALEALDDAQRRALGAAAGAVGDRDEARRQRFQPANASPELGFHRFGARRHELEREQRRRMPGLAHRQGAKAGAGQPALQGGEGGGHVHSALCPAESSGSTPPTERYASK